MAGFVRDGGRWVWGGRRERGSAEESSTYVIFSVYI